MYFLGRNGGDIGAAIRMYTKCQRALYDQSTYFPCLGSIGTADYDVALSMFSDPQQAHAFATSFDMHSVVNRFCPFYSLGQTMKTVPFEFINDLHWAINERAKDLFSTNCTPQSVYKPTDNTNANQLFAASIAATYYKVFGRELSDENIKCFESNKGSLAVIGVLPTQFLSFFSAAVSSQYWAMTSLWRKLILEDEAVRDIVVRVAAKHGLDQSVRSLNHCINSFCVEVLPGCAGIACAVAMGLKQFNSAQGDEQRANFKSNPEDFAMECLRMDGAPYIARTVMKGWTQIEVDGTERALHRDNCIISDIGTIGRCPMRFTNPDEFDPKRTNLTVDPFIFGSTEKLIRSNQAVKQCPLHDFSIMMVQEMLARIAGIEVDVMYNGQRFEKSYVA